VGRQSCETAAPERSAVRIRPSRPVFISGPGPHAVVRESSLLARRTIHSIDRGGISDAALIQRLLEESHVPGVSIAIIKDFKIVLAVAYGVTNVSTGSPVTTDTMFQAASISKPVAAMASLNREVFANPLRMPSTSKHLQFT
jgi:CubicO group peptidase (beta-lactamase class C family)